MTTSITMPQLGETVLEGTIIRWLKQVGETVQLDESLFEISTDKVDTEVPSPITGIVDAILVAEGTTVPVGTEVARLRGADEAGQAAGDTVLSPAIDAPVATTTGTAPEKVGAGAGADAGAGAGATSERAVVKAPVGSGPRSIVLSPVVRRLAREHRVDLSQVPGTGDGGRITRRDVERFIQAPPETGLTAVTDIGPAGAPPTAVTPPAAPPPPHPGAAPTLRVVQPVPGPREEVRPLSHIRKQIASHMVASQHAAARAWTVIEVDMENVVRVREREKEAFKAREGYSLTYLPFVARAVCEALLAFPDINSELRDDQQILHRYVNLGIAVSYEDGLIVPVIDDADTRNLVGLARAINDLATRARIKRLQPGEVQGATFTITNPGPFGSVMSLPIINQPNSAILSLDAIEQRPVVIDNAIAIRHRVYLSLSWDHRVVDGATATQFLARVKESLENWDFAEDLGT